MSLVCVLHNYRRYTHVSLQLQKFRRYENKYEKDVHESGIDIWIFFNGKYYYFLRKDTVTRGKGSCINVVFSFIVFSSGIFGCPYKTEVKTENMKTSMKSNFSRNALRKRKQ